jgi:hypothetical protein
MKRIIAVVCMLLVSTAVWAGDQAMNKQMSAKQMEMMKSEMMKCDVCKHMAMHLDEIGPVQAEVVQLNDGMAMIHNVSPDKVAIFHQAGAECAQAGMEAMNLTDAQAQTQLCPMCQGIRSAVKAGATLSNGETKNGDIMVLTSNDPKVQTQLGALADKCAMMMGEGQAKR